MSGLLAPLDEGQGYLKAGFLGFNKSGKTWTAIDLAVGARKFFELDGPIAMFDTENGSPFVAPRVKAGTGKALIGVRGRSFDALLGTAHEAEAAGCSVLIVDSISHPWEELCASYLEQVNKARKLKRLDEYSRLEFHHWAPIKKKWAEWANWYINSPVHVIVCGRAGYEWDFEARDDGTDKKDLVKTGVKMKTEGQFGFEPSLLVMMDQIQDVGSKSQGGVTVVHRATVLGDRSGVLTGLQADDPSFEFFLPHLQTLTPGAHAVVDTTTQTQNDVTEEGQSRRAYEKKQSEILCEEIQGHMVRAWPGQTVVEKAARLDAIEAAFNTRSWTYVESLRPDALRPGLEVIKVCVAKALHVAPEGKS